ncbi:MAG: glutamyl-tRNA reductase [Bacteroidetes bacterium]|nr:glutamyl-tRNA reductase [Bacteroidota bacterium]
MYLLKTIAFTHKNTPIKELNRFFLHEENRKERLEYLKFSCDIDEIFYVATCNRIEFFFTTHHILDHNFLRKFYRHFRNDWNSEEVDFAIKYGEIFEGEDALRHIYRVASSLDSLVIGEREIITQVRKAYDLCKDDGLTGDMLRLVVKSTITTAKQVYTETKIANNPVSVVSLAERKLRDYKLDRNSRILIIGSGETNTNLSKYLVKQGFTNFTIFNRTVNNAEKLAKIIQSAAVKATAFLLDQLENYQGGFDVLVTCTASPDKIITPELFAKLKGADVTTKVIVDLSVPSNISCEVLEANKANVIDVNELKEIASANLEERQNEYVAAEELIEENIKNFRQLHRTRSLELKMRNVPEKIREIKDKAMNDVFAAEINGLDEHSREVLGRVLDYMEKKCISVPMVMAKEIILETTN